MPPPIKWQACPSAAGSVQCQELSTSDWDDGQGGAIAYDVGFGVDAQGAARLLMQRLAINGGGDAQSYVDWVEGPADGPLDFAIRHQRADSMPTCSALIGDIAPNVFSLDLLGDGTGPTTTTDVDGLLLGSFGSPTPTLAYRDTNPGTNGWSIGSARVVQNNYGQITAHPTDFTSSVPLYPVPNDPENLPYNGRAALFGHDALFQIGNLQEFGLMAYNDTLGTHSLLRYVGDTSQGAGNLGSDGKDIVWSHGEGKGPTQGDLYTVMSIITAPYTTDPAQLTPRRLHSDLSVGMGTHELQFAVGCGYAGRELVAPDSEIVRLSDGATWRLTGSASWAWSRVFGFTCDEAFVAVYDTPQRYRIARIKLSSLGQPLPAD